MKTRAAGIVVLCYLLCAPVFGASHEASAVSADQALALLKAGNAVFVTGQSQHHSVSVARRQEIAPAQHPFAVIVGCSDSRVPPETIFDRGLGDLFVVRDAGNVVWDIEIGSIEYAAEHLGVQLVVVLGHTRCGAVSAAVKGTGDEAGHIGSIVKMIAPAVDNVKGEPGDEVENAVMANIALVRDHIRSSKPVLATLVSEKKLMVVGAYYDLDSGVVEFLPETSADGARK